MVPRDLRFSFSLSLFLHLVLISLLMGRWLVTPRPPTELIWIDVQPTSKNWVKKNDDNFARQVVQTAKSHVIERPVPNAFLGERTQEVVEQTVKLGKQPELGDSGKNHRRTATHNRLGDLNRLGFPIFPKSGSVDEEPHTFSDAQSISPSDYVRGMKEGDRTALNTREYVFFGYFQRIRERLDRAWIPILRQKLIGFHRNGRQLASNMDHTTKVIVTLDASGTIIRVRMISESGSKELDEAAVQAFNRAGPFPNPPKGIVNAQGEIEIPWEFILKT